METRRIVWKSSGPRVYICSYIYTYRERLRIFTISARVRLHTWRLGLTALILKNCHLSPDDLLFTPRASSSSCSSLSGSFNRSRHPYASPRHPSHRGAKLRRFAPFRANFSTDFSSPFRGKHPCHDQESTLWKRGGRLAHLQAVHTNRLGLEVTKWREYVVGISGKIV